MIEAEDPSPRLKEQLAAEIVLLLRGGDQFLAAEGTGVDQPRISNLVHGRLDRFSLEKLIRILSRLGRRVDLTVVDLGTVNLKPFRPYRRPELRTPSR